MNTLGIIGFGQFGQFMARHLSPHFDVHVCDSGDRAAEASEIGVKWTDFETVSASETLVFAVPIDSLENVLNRAVTYLRPGALCLDVCSVKIRPLALMSRILPPSVEVIGTHPLFGPQSGSTGIEGLRITLCPVRGKRVVEVRSFLGDVLKLSVLERTPEEHDQEMAHVQALTHFVARALDELHVVDSDLATVSYEEIMKAARLVSEDSWELFRTIQNGNPFAATKRRAFIKKLIELEDRLDER